MVYDNSDARVVSASHIRFQSVTLSYNLPKSLIEGTGINHMNIGIQGSNLGYLPLMESLEDRILSRYQV